MSRRYVVVIVHVPPSVPRRKESRGCEPELMLDVDLKESSALWIEA